MNEMQDTKISLALSGGGVRALVFHLGVLLRLARSGKMENVSFVSTVSGGSLAICLVLAQSLWKWPSSDEFEKNVLPKCRFLLTERSILFWYLVFSLAFPWRLLRGRASVLGSVIKRLWNVNFNLSNLPASPRWVINATTFETGKNWIFSHKRMGDYVVGYVPNPEFPLAEAVASSAGFPGGIGPLKLVTSEYSWHQYSGKNSELKPSKPLFSILRLWDGGVYDNLGVEPLYKPSGGLREGTDFLIVSDASKALDTLEYRIRRTGLRLLYIAQDQVRSIRSRDLSRFFEENPGSGVYLRIGNTYSHIYQRAKKNLGVSDELLLKPQMVKQAGDFSTTLRKISAQEFELLLKHGYEVADATLSSYCEMKFKPIPF